MKIHRYAVASALLGSLLFMPGAIADVIDNWCTSYVNVQQGGLHKLGIRKDDKGKVKVHAYAYGFPDDSDWGESEAELYPDQGGPGFLGS